jgi:hypothetical protein
MITDIVVTLLTVLGILQVVLWAILNAFPGDVVRRYPDGKIALLCAHISLVLAVSMMVVVACIKVLQW